MKARGGDHLRNCFESMGLQPLNMKRSGLVCRDSPTRRYFSQTARLIVSVKIFITHDYQVSVLLWHSVYVGDVSGRDIRRLASLLCAFYKRRNEMDIR